MEFTVVVYNRTFIRKVRIKDFSVLFNISKKFIFIKNRRNNGYIFVGKCFQYEPIGFRTGAGL